MYNGEAVWKGRRRMRVMKAKEQMMGPGYEVDKRKLKGLRLRRRLTQQKLAELAGLSVTQVSRIEQGVHTPRFSTLEKLADALGIDADDLIDYDDVPLVAS
jgi:DNA-binding Xre family transcriptional regulator